MIASREVETELKLDERFTLIIMRIVGGVILETWDEKANECCGIRTIADKELVQKCWMKPNNTEENE